jgi:hypothetical protein
MKKDFCSRPEKDEAGWVTWQGSLTAIPSLVFLVTGWKSNGKANAGLRALPVGDEIGGRL